MGQQVMVNFRNISVISIVLILFSFLGCSTPKNKALRGIYVGMDKSDVLDRVGNPDHKSRQFNQDRWAYVAEDETTGHSTTYYIFFSEGRVTYIDQGDSSGAKLASPKSPGSFAPIGH